jgi:hypothetical protein
MFMFRIVDPCSVAESIAVLIGSLGNRILANLLTDGDLSACGQLAE